MQMGEGDAYGDGDRVRERETDGGGIDGFRGGRELSTPGRARGEDCETAQNS